MQSIPNNVPRNIYVTRQFGPPSHPPTLLQYIIEVDVGSKKLPPLIFLISSTVKPAGYALIINYTHGFRFRDNLPRKWWPLHATAKKTSRSVFMNNSRSGKLTTGGRSSGELRVIDQFLDLVIFY